MKAKPKPPLAERLRPTHWDEVIGQTHLLGPGKPLRLTFESGKPHSMIFWGPPGVGKTTLARLSALAFHCEWIALSAVLAGVKDIRDAVDQAQKHLLQQKQTLLFIDEIHRFNKAQQDALLPFTESGLLTFMGATTENPSFEVNNALLSRSQVYILKPLSEEELGLLFDKAHTQVLNHLSFAGEAKAYIVGHANGDARRLLNILEQIEAAASVKNTLTISEELVKEVVVANARLFDKGGDYFYDQISALHKSVRGSHPDAALYWLTSMLVSGTDPHYLARRIIRMAWEDIGLADPRAAEIAMNAANTYDRLGSPEGELALAQAVIYMAIAPKSNASYLAYNQAIDFVKQDTTREVPLHLRNAPTKLMNKLGYGKKYRYAHNEPHAYAAGENYFPEKVNPPAWYKPVPRGLELKIQEKLNFLKQLDEEFKRES